MSKHVLHTVYTAQYRYAGLDRTDITVKGFDAYGKYFAPSWNMVFGIKNETMSQQQYVDAYLKIIDDVPVRILDWFFSRPTRTLVCFCAEEAFCHRNILINYLVQIYGDRIKNGGFRQKMTP
jgi:hypothetical protein